MKRSEDEDFEPALAIKSDAINKFDGVSRTVSSKKSTFYSWSYRNVNLLLLNQLSVMQTSTPFPLVSACGNKFPTSEELS